MCLNVLLDTNIYDKLDCDFETRECVAAAVAAGRLRIIATSKIEVELQDSPLGSLPDWFPIELRPDNVAVLDHWRLGMAALGDGEVFAAHKGTSKKIPDAIIADSADAYAHIFVSEDHRARKRLDESSNECRTLDYSEFCDWLRNYGRSEATHAGERSPSGAKNLCKSS